jgi:hypothetical protein
MGRNMFGPVRGPWPDYEWKGWWGDWRAAAWTVTVGIVLAVVGLIDLGLPAHLAFLDHLPRLLSGESFPNFPQCR